MGTWLHAQLPHDPTVNLFLGMVLGITLHIVLGIWAKK